MNRPLLLVFCLMLQGFADNEVLLQIEHRLDRFPVTRGEFIQENHLAVLRKPLVSRGRFLHHEKKGINWQVETPLPNQVLINKGRIVSLNQTGMPVEAGGFAEIFQSVLSGDFSRLTEVFEVEGVIDAHQWQLSLVPKVESQAKVVRIIRMSGDRQLRELILHHQNSDKTRIFLTITDHSPQLSEAEEADFAQLNP